MGSLDFLVTYVQACGSGMLALSECGPAWQFGVIGLLVASAIAALIALRVRAYVLSARS
jgi:hypothetical protein